MKLLTIITICLIMSGCYTESSIKEEKAEVIQLAYIPETNGTGSGMTSNGGIVVTSNHSPEVWAVVFRCFNHNMTFSLSGKEIYSKSKIGRIVTLKYVDKIKKDGTVFDYDTKEVFFE